MHLKRRQVMKRQPMTNLGSLEPTREFPVDGAAGDLHTHLKTVETPLNRLGEKELCPGAAALAALNAELI